MNITISGLFSNSEEDELMRIDHPNNVQLEIIREYGLQVADVLSVTFQLVQNVGFNAIYDMLKHVILKAVAIKKSNGSGRFEVFIIQRDKTEVKKVRFVIDRDLTNKQFEIVVKGALDIFKKMPSVSERCD